MIYFIEELKTPRAGDTCCSEPCKCNQQTKKLIAKLLKCNLLNVVQSND